MSERLTQLRKLYDADPDDPFVSYGLALEHAKLGDNEEAIKWLDRTITADALYAYAYFQKGRLLSELGRDDEAKAVLREGIAQATEAGDAHAAEEIGTLLASLDEG